MISSPAIVPDRSGASHRAISRLAFWTWTVGRAWYGVLCQGVAAGSGLTMTGCIRAPSTVHILAGMLATALDRAQGIGLAVGQEGVPRAADGLGTTERARRTEDREAVPAPALHPRDDRGI